MHSCACTTYMHTCMLPYTRLRMHAQMHVRSTLLVSPWSMCSVPSPHLSCQTRERCASSCTSSIFLHSSESLCARASMHAHIHNACKGHLSFQASFPPSAPCHTVHKIMCKCACGTRMRTQMYRERGRGTYLDERGLRWHRGRDGRTEVRRR